MVDMVSFQVKNEAKGKARPRVTQDGGHTYTPDPDGWVSLVTDEATRARTNPAWAEYKGPVAMVVTVARAMPMSWSRKKKARLDGEICLRIPDTVNIAAAICDALNHVLYADDRQVYYLDIVKEWGYEHGTWITLRYADEGELE